MEITDHIERIRQNTALLQQGEEATRQGAVLPLLQGLGWCTYDTNQVTPEYGISGQRVDYRLTAGPGRDVFLEVKKAGDDRLDSHQEQLLKYAFSEGVPLAVLTNGLAWWFYLAMAKGNWEQRKFIAVDLTRLDPEDSARQLKTYLSYEQIQTGQAVADAEKLHASNSRKQAIRQTIPRAWDEVLAEPDEILLDLFAERVESLCSYRPDEADLKRHIEQYTSHRPAPVPAPVPAPAPVRPTTPSPRPRPTPPHPGGSPYTGTRPTSVKVLGMQYTVRSWKDVLMAVCDSARDRHGADFSRVLGLKGRSRSYFTEDPQALRSAVGVPGTDLFVETNLSATNIMDLCHKVLALWGHPEDAMILEVR